MKTKRIVVFLLCAILLVTGCGKKKNEGAGPVKGGVMDGEAISAELANYVFKSEKIGGIDGESINDCIVKNEQVYVMSVTWKEGEGAVTYGGELRDVEEEAVEDAAVEDVAIDAAEAETTEDTAVEEKRIASDGIAIDDVAMGGVDDGLVEDYEYTYDPGTVELNITGKDFSGKTVFEYRDNRSGDCNAYGLEVGNDGSVYFILNEYGNETNNYEDQYSIVCLGTDGNVKWVSTLDKSISDGSYIYLSKIIASENGVAVITSVGIQNLNNDGEPVSFVKNDKLIDISYVLPLKDGRVATVIYGEDVSLNVLNMETAAIGESIAVPFNLYSYGFSSGCGLYDMTLTSQSGIYVFNIGDEKPTKIMDYMASDINASNISFVSFINDEKFYGCYYDDAEESYTMYMFTKVDPSTVANKQIIVVGGMWVDSNVRNRMIEFNRSSDKYRVVIKDYTGEDYVDYDTLIQTINNDIVTGNMPDIMMLTTDLNKYLGMGVFADLNEYFANDPSVNKDDYLANIFEAATFDGKLEAIIPSFYVQTLAGKASVLGNRNSWNIKEFNEFIKAQGSSTPMGLMSKMEFLNTELMVAYDDFINRENAEAKFDTQEFIDVLKATDIYPEEVDWESLDDDYWQHYESYFRDNTYLLSAFSLYGYAAVSQNIQTTFGEPVTFIGYPVAEGNGHALTYELAVSLNDKSKVKDGAWEIMKIFLSDEYQENGVYSFPVKKSALAKRAEIDMKPSTYIDEETGEEIEYHDTYFLNGIEMEYKKPTQKEIDEINNIIASTTRIASYEQGIINIISEEAATYFSGQKSAEEVAKIIQGRVQLYLNENN